MLLTEVNLEDCFSKRVNCKLCHYYAWSFHLMNNGRKEEGLVTASLPGIRKRFSDVPGSRSMSSATVMGG